MKTVAIVNPAARRHQAGRIWKTLLETLKHQAPHLTTWWTTSPGQAEVLAARARRQGYERVLAGGGDGTVFEVANGLWWEPRGRLPSIGLIPLGTGCDYMRNFPRGPALRDCVDQALGEATVAVAVGVLRVQTPPGKSLERVCLNVLGLGFDAQVVRRMRRQQLPLGGKIPYFLSGLQELLFYNHFRLTGQMDGESFESHSSLLVAGLGRYFGGGMNITPGASLQAGCFQVVWDQGLKRLAILCLMGKIYTGGHLAHPQVQSRFARHLEVTADPPAVVQVEGELVGQTPLELRLSPQRLQVAAAGCFLQ